MESFLRCRFIGEWVVKSFGLNEKKNLIFPIKMTNSTKFHFLPYRLIVIAIHTDDEEDDEEDEREKPVNPNFKGSRAGSRAASSARGGRSRAGSAASVRKPKRNSSVASTSSKASSGGKSKKSETKDENAAAAPAEATEKKKGLGGMFSKFSGLKKNVDKFKDSSKVGVDNSAATSAATSKASALPEETKK